MTAATTDHTHYHGGWHSHDAQGPEVPRRTAAAHEPVATEAEAARWLDDGGSQWRGAIVRRAVTMADEHNAPRLTRERETTREER